MAGYRQDKINEQVRITLSESLRDVKDPRIAGAFVSITDVEVSRDLSFAKVFFSVLGGDADEVHKGLQSAGGFLRGSLAEKLNLRLTPKLTFVEDESTQRAFRINQLLKEDRHGE